jgi:hypothetical protein
LRLRSLSGSCVAALLTVSVLTSCATSETSSPEASATDILSYPTEQGDQSKPSFAPGAEVTPQESTKAAFTQDFNERVALFEKSGEGLAVQVAGSLQYDGVESAISRATLNPDGTSVYEVVRLDGEGGEPSGIQVLCYEETKCATSNDDTLWIDAPDFTEIAKGFVNDTLNIFATSDSNSPSFTTEGDTLTVEAFSLGLDARIDRKTSWTFAGDTVVVKTRELEDGQVIESVVTAVHGEPVEVSKPKDIQKNAPVKP